MHFSIQSFCCTQHLTWSFNIRVHIYVSTHYLHITIYIDVSTDLVLEHRVLVGHEVDVDVPGPVADHHHQAQHEEEDEEVGGLGRKRLGLSG